MSRVWSGWAVSNITNEHPILYQTKEQAEEAARFWSAQGAMAFPVTVREDSGERMTREEAWKHVHRWSQAGLLFDDPAEIAAFLRRVADGLLEGE